jgi:hypothetical protein
MPAFGCNRTRRRRNGQRQTDQSLSDATVKLLRQAHVEPSAAHPPAAFTLGPRWRWDKASANCVLVIPRMTKCRLFAAKLATTDAFSLCTPASLPLIRRVSDEVSESGGPELLGRIPRRAVGGAGSFSASPSANSVGRRERGCLQCERAARFVCGVTGPRAERAPALACARAGRPGSPELGEEGQSETGGCREGARTPPPDAGGGPTAPRRPSPPSAHVGRG